MRVLPCPLRILCSLLLCISMVPLAATSAHSMINYGLRYDGNNDVLRQTECLSTSGDAPFTLELWILRRSGGDTWQEIGDSRGFSLFIHSSSRLCLNLASPGNEPSPACCYRGGMSTYTRYRSVLSIPIGSWTHIAITWDGTQPTAYVNGAGDPMAYDITQYSFTCCDFGDAGACFTPDAALITIDEVRVWDFARTEEEIRSTMNGPLTGTEPGLVHYWPMDEGAGQVAADRVAGNHLQLGISSEPDEHDPS